MLLKLFAGLSLPVSVLLFVWLDAALWVLPLLYLGALAVFILLAFAFLALMCVPVDLHKPQHEDSKFYRKAMYLYIELIIQLLGAEISTAGLEHIPTARRFVLVCNHQNEVDPAILHHYFSKSQLAFISKKEVVSMPIIAHFCHKTLCQLINRENDREGLKTIVKCIQMIREDKCSVGVFPEGGIYERDKLNHFRSGVFKIAQKADVPIVVCTLKGTSDALIRIKHFKKIRCRLHLVGILPEWEHREMTTVQISEKVYSMMLEDLGEEYRLEAAQTT